MPTSVRIFRMSPQYRTCAALVPAQLLKGPDWKTLPLKLDLPLGSKDFQESSQSSGLEDLAELRFGLRTASDINVVNEMGNLRTRDGIFYQ